MSALQKWQEVGDDFTAVVLVAGTAWLDAIERGIEADDLPPGAWREVWLAVQKLRGQRTKDGAEAADRPITDAEIAAECSTKVTAEWVAARMGFYDELRQNAFPQTCELLKKHARGFRMVTLLRAKATELQAAVAAGDDVDDIADAVVQGITEAQKVRDTTSVTASALVELIEENSEKPPQIGLTTGLVLVDNWFPGGFRPGELVALVAPFKGRKTSFLAHTILHLTRVGKSVTFVSLDESRETFIYRLFAALIAEYAFGRGWLNPLNQNGVFDVDGDTIRGAGNRWRGWDKRLKEARAWALEELRKIGTGLRIYDTRTGAAHPRRLRAIAQHDAQRYGLDMLAFDHVQRFEGWPTTYEKVEYGSALLHALAGELEMVVWALSQKNAESIKAGNVATYSAGTKGGGGLESNADFTFVLEYGEGARITDKRFLGVMVKHARRADAPRFGYVNLHKPSGFISPRLPTRQEIDTALELS